MDLQLLASEIVETPNVYDGVKNVFVMASQVTDIATEKDIDALMGVLSMSLDVQLTNPLRSNTKVLLAQATVAKRYVDYGKDGDNFI